MDLTDTWVEWHYYSKQMKKSRGKNPSLWVLSCGLCERDVTMDEDFDIYSSALEVIENQIDDGFGSSIVCVPCVATRLPALAKWVGDYRTLRATRAALIDASH